MSELIDRIPGAESAVAAIRRVTDTSAELKSRQRLTGRSGQLAYRIESSDTWDLIESLPVPPGSSYVTASFRVTYTGDGTQDFPIAVPFTDVRINGIGDGNRMSVIPSSGLYTYEDGGCDVIVQAFEFPDPDFFESALQNAWTIDLLYSGTVVVYMKTRGQATSAGSFEVVRIS